MATFLLLTTTLYRQFSFQDEMKATRKKLMQKADVKSKFKDRSATPSAEKMTLKCYFKLH